MILHACACARCVRNKPATSGGMISKGVKFKTGKCTLERRLDGGAAKTFQHHVLRAVNDRGGYKGEGGWGGGGGGWSRVVSFPDPIY